MVRQWGRLHCRTSPLACSLRWHLWAWSKRTSCCWINLRFSGSAVGAAALGPTPTVPRPTWPTPVVGTDAPPTGTLTAPGCCSWCCEDLRDRRNTNYNIMHLCVYMCMYAQRIVTDFASPNCQKLTIPGSVFLSTLNWLSILFGMLALFWSCGPSPAPGSPWPAVWLYGPP